MAGVQLADLQSRPTEFPDFTSLTVDEFQQLVPPFETAFQAHMAAWALSQSCLWEAKSENVVLKIQWFVWINFPVFGDLRQSPWH